MSTAAPHRRGLHRSKGLAWVVIAVLCVMMRGSVADPGLQLLAQIAALAGTGWQLEGLKASLTSTGTGPLKLQLTATAASLPDPLGEVKDLRLSCPVLRLRGSELRCPAGRLRLRHPLLSRRPIALSFSYSAVAGLSLQFSDLGLARGSAAGLLRWKAGRWDLGLKARRVSLPRLSAVLAPERARAFQPLGTVDIDVQLKGASRGVEHLSIDLDVEHLAFADPSSRHVGEALTGQVHLSGERGRTQWSVQARSAWRAGQLYIDPFFVDLAANPVELSLAGRWRPDEGLFVLRQGHLSQQGILEASATGRVSLDESVEIRQLEIRLVKARMSELYATYLQPLVIGTSLDDLDVDGRAEGLVRIDAQGTHVTARIRGLGLDDRQGRFGGSGLAADLRWQERGPPLRSRVSFERAHVYGLELGASALTVESTGGALRLVQPVSIPVFDGELKVNELAFEDLGTEALSWRLDAALTPLSMASFTEAVGLPRMSGHLSGMIPEVQYRDGVLAVGGAILIRVFDGAVVVTDLRLEDPFGTVPRLTANIAIEDLDLHALTRRFSFGEIRGRLSGRVKDLELVNWRPVRFDLWLATPENDRSRRRISQRAVEAISSLGSGVSGALSRSFLRIFKTFSYGKLGLSCRLRNGVCLMDGIAPAGDGGYYLVKGAGLPRIDVIGHVREVDWNELIERLQAVTRGTAATAP